MNAFGPPRHKNAGFTVVELLAAVAIVAMLMAALATAMQGVTQSYSANSDIAQATQAARVVLNRMMAEVRTATEANGNAHFLSILLPPNPDGTTEIQYELVDGTLVRRQIGGVAANTVDLISADEQIKVTDFTVTRDPLNGVPCTQSVTVVLGLQVKDNAMQVTASAALRKNMTY